MVFLYAFSIVWYTVPRINALWNYACMTQPKRLQSETGIMRMINAIIFLAVMFLVYHYLVFAFIDTLLRKPRLKKIFRIPVGIVNMLIIVVYTSISGNAALGVYLLIGMLLFIEFMFFYEDKWECCLFCTLACAIHIMAARSLCVVGFAIGMHSTFYDIVNVPLLLVLSTGITLMFINVIVVLVIRFVPAKSVRVINQHDTQLWFMIAWLTVFCTYLLINADVYNTPNSHPTLLANQITAPITVLIGTYIVLFFSIEMGKLLGYKEKNEELQHTMEAERQYRTTIDKDVFRVIEVNFNKNLLLSGFEDYQEQLGDAIYDYGKMLKLMVQKTVHSEDRDKFIKYLLPQTVIDEFDAGATEIVFDYRRRMPEGNYVWMHVLMALMRDKQSQDVRGFVQIKNIDLEKRKQLELQYKAERDLLTGLYNKGTTEMMISKQLFEDKNNDVAGVLFIIDIDNFKMINDRLGHLYGDAVLSELSEGLRKVFRDSDLVGRIGGDEFLVFAVGLREEHKIIEKAQSICNVFLRTYANEKNEGYTVSSSIGIAVFPKDGESFEELYGCADAALYATKANGKNGYSFYDTSIKMSYVSTRTEIDTHGIVQKSFKDNRIEYVFRLLYGSEDTKAAIESVLELIAKNFGFSRANIFQFNEFSTHFNSVFEWCAVGIDSVSANYIDMPVSNFDFIVLALAKSGGMFAAVPTDFPEFAQESYTSIGIKSIVHFSITEQDKLIGVIAFQDCLGENFHLSETEFEELRTICQVLSIFMAKQLGNDREQRHHQAIEAVMDNMNSIAYVIDRETYVVYYENQNPVNITGQSSIGSKCYASYRGFEEPCKDCPLQYLSQEKPRCTLELYTEKFNIYTKTSAALINWSNDREAMLISSVDVTEYK